MTQNAKQKILVFVILLQIVSVLPLWAESPWKFRMTSETSVSINAPFDMIAAADLNGNGIKELIVTDFGRGRRMFYEEERGVYDDRHNLYVLEWEKGSMKRQFHKGWKRNWEGNKDGFEARWSEQMVVWPIKDQVMVETLPPYLGIEWEKGKYVLHEQLGAWQKTPQVGSWALPWVSPNCYFTFGKTEEKIIRECIVGVRDFSGKGQPKVVSILEEEIIKAIKYKQLLRIRNFDQDFSIEWELELDTEKRLTHLGSEDRFFYGHMSNFLLIAEPGKEIWSWHLLNLKKNGYDYQLKPIIAKGDYGIDSYEFLDVYLRATKQSDAWEYWGHYKMKIPNHPYVGFLLMLCNVRLNSDNSSFIKEDVDFFPHHEPFLGVGHFVVEDIDGDGLHEIILVEETGKVSFGHETVNYHDTKDYIRILKWDGEEYKTMWVSPPYNSHYTKLLVEDIKGTGKKQLMVLLAGGTIQIWERQ